MVCQTPETTCVIPPQSLDQSPVRMPAKMLMIPWIVERAAEMIPEIKFQATWMASTM